MLTILDYEKDDKNRVLCICECGVKKKINIYNVLKGTSSSCGCFKKTKMKEEAKKRFTNKKPVNYIDYTGKKIGFVTVVKRIDDARKWITTYLLKCDCGTNFISEISSLRRSKFETCTCGYKKHPLKNILQRMINRCYEPSEKAYCYYGGKGIKVCEDWIKYPIKFIEWSINNGWKDCKGMKRKEILSIDRIDSDKDYCPENCQWITLSDNSKKAMEKRWQK